MRIQEALGRVELRQLKQQTTCTLEDNELRVFSQWGEDGIIQLLVRNIPTSRKVFVEFGVENYQEANTRFLLINDNWAGLVLDSSHTNIESVQKSDLYWRYNLKAQQSFITRENINEILSNHGLTGDIGLLSIDIDGNDYWIWEAVVVAKPIIVVIEYNSRFGRDRAVTVPYDPQFSRRTAHYSMIYYGASLKALQILGEKKGYSLIGCNSAGNNAFFVRRDMKPAHIKERDVPDAYVEAKFRESRDEIGGLSFLDADQEAVILDSLPVVEIRP